MLLEVTHVNKDSGSAAEYKSMSSSKTEKGLGDN